MQKPKIAISIGDINGIGLEIAIRSHSFFCQFCEPYYFIHYIILQKALKLLNLPFKNANLVEFGKGKEKFIKLCCRENYTLYSFQSDLSFEFEDELELKPSQIDMKSGLYSYLSFEAALRFVCANKAQALLTLPVHKKAWELGGISFKGHTDALRHFFQKDAIMMLGCKELFIGLFTEHMPLRKVSSVIRFKTLSQFLIDFHIQTGFEKIGVLAFNPHAGDYGVIGGEEEIIIQEAIEFANAYIHSLKSTKFLHTHKLTQENLLKKALKSKKLQNALKSEFGACGVYLPSALVADTAFTKESLKQCNRLVALYHDLALAPLKALYFEKSVNVSLNLPIIRVSVDHGTAYDKAYKNAGISTASYKQALKTALYFLRK
ncbi:4-hydroxythreonine-4-phosphate dehydrogenase [Campylobacter sp. MIT 21-1685]|uniref:4-hydroxythreonine-4-phosphate dehydrogenase n=1 Tax=unclassified Campylobacter TaxID=2593542 RepID=UPI00224B8A64|nr:MULTISPECIES: 4-hydroxythreonine-4-phosphate dehydrogenase [unclassified Campylobacter]MCX2682489.1 4-hydroxythreonine-4-phosphate dehydrogenase [Campylobacter sp. MIT 21-1684]MCX2750798.1 4-hydroxythreonine-4-phosphate dehydrogenase [Campylobacter sp. MIT 21-1682]MCX2806970.1 4-hydroxythreonine-4-phosphate dehydrogenase [Campylobacter sp. MIT 21-1685]